MKNLISFTIVLCFSINSFSQNQGPDIAWKYHDIPDDVVSGTIIDLISPTSFFEGGPLTFDRSGEDWWYDIVNIYETSVHVGYMVCGFSTWQDVIVDETMGSPGLVM